ncbi:type II toxin-antitoxin system HicB family antitoxin [Nocardia sp. IBHARD005]|uniref:type II toxin-antitoxin system HicB family antitoxin n=1 Tax=Nocardia sp. IBHARD005 TaxID=3457765 RepID=UPI004059C2B6
MKYTAHAERDGRFWLIHVPEIDQWTQARNLREVESMARDLVATMLEANPNSFEVEVEVELPEAVRAEWEESKRLLTKVDEIKASAAAAAQRAARRLADEGLTLREIGQVLGVSFQRAGQLLNR